MRKLAVVLIFLASVALVGWSSSKTSSASPTSRSTAFCIKAPHNKACPNSFLRSQTALLHNMWEGYVTDSACYPKNCGTWSSSAAKAEVLSGITSTAKKWLPEVQGNRARTPAAKALKAEIVQILADAHTVIPSWPSATTTTT